ncbi:MAG: hypothetical protein ACREQ5_41295, partial [Candidatus Dormibacteria bacterium]
MAIAGAHRQPRVARKTRVAVRQVTPHEHRPSAWHDTDVRAGRTQASGRVNSRGLRHLVITSVCCVVRSTAR